MFEEINNRFNNCKVNQDFIKCFVGNAISISNQPLVETTLKKVMASSKNKINTRNIFRYDNFVIIHKQNKKFKNFDKDYIRKIQIDDKKFVFEFSEEQIFYLCFKHDMVDSFWNYIDEITYVKRN